MTCDRDGCKREARWVQDIHWAGGGVTRLYRCDGGHTTVRSEGE